MKPGRPRVKILGRILRSARDQVARKLAEILDAITSTNSKESWERLCLFSARCLHAPPRGGHSRSLVSYIKRSVAEEMDVVTSNSHPPCPSPNLRFADPLKGLAARVAAKLEEGDFRGAVKIVSSTDSFVPLNETTLKHLQTKHPQSNPNTSMPPPLSQDLDSISISTPEVLRTIQSFPAGSAGGPDGLRPQHLKDLIFNKPVRAPTSESLTRFVCLVIKGEVPVPA